ncbi:MAG: murein biosynthesis integral membrane protein MurJ [Candidatus Omnitrophota bacterium]|nr:murein biosynthesis integral membrane protein MurJ [Candidatus Omnitrophota bacterium]
MSKSKLIKSTGTIGVATAISRVLGFVRDIVIAKLFGTAIYAQAFVVAFRISNLLRDLVGEGAMNSVFVPVFTDELTKNGRREFLKLAQVVLNIMFWLLLAAAIAGVLAAPFIVRIIAPGFLMDAEKFQITVILTRFLFPFLVLVGLWAYAMGVLNTLGYFAAPAFGPCLLNLSMILCAIWFGENVFGLVAGVLAGGFLQLIIQLPPLYSSGWSFKITKEFSHPKAGKIGVLLIPRAIGACVYQVNVFISTILASLSSIAGEGAVAAIYYANRLWQLPLAIFGIALAQAALPAMSRHVASSDITKLKDTVLFSVKALFFILIPSSNGLMMLAVPMTKVLFERGAFTAYSSAITSNALFFYAFGLVACGGIKVLVNAFYSMHDTATPAKTAGASLVLNIALALILMRPLKVGGLALATSASATFNFLALYFLLEKRLGDFGRRSLLDSLLRVISASIIMAAVLKFLLIYFVSFNAFILALTVTAGFVSFIAASYILRVKELREGISWITRRR